MIDPATEEVFATCARASEGQLDQAVAAAKAAFPAWSATPIERRRAILEEVADVVVAHAEEIGRAGLDEFTQLKIVHIAR